MEHKSRRFKIVYADGKEEEIEAETSDFRGDLLVFFQWVRRQAGQYEDLSPCTVLEPSVLTTRRAKDISSIDDVTDPTIRY